MCVKKGQQGGRRRAGIANQNHTRGAAVHTAAEVVESIAIIENHNQLSIGINALTAEQQHIMVVGIAVNIEVAKEDGSNCLAKYS